MINKEKKIARMINNEIQQKKDGLILQCPITEFILKLNLDETVIPDSRTSYECYIVEADNKYILFESLFKREFIEILEKITKAKEYIISEDNMINLLNSDHIKESDIKCEILRELVPNITGDNIKKITDEGKRENLYDCYKEIESPKKKAVRMIEQKRVEQLEKHKAEKKARSDELLKQEKAKEEIDKEFRIIIGEINRNTQQVFNIARPSRLSLKRKQKRNEYEKSLESTNNNIVEELKKISTVKNEYPDNEDIFNEAFDIKKANILSHLENYIINVKKKILNMGTWKNIKEQIEETVKKPTSGDDDDTFKYFRERLKEDLKMSKFQTLRKSLGGGSKKKIKRKKSILHKRRISKQKKRTYKKKKNTKRKGNKMYSKKRSNRKTKKKRL